MEGSITWVGIDAHKKTLAIAALSPDGRIDEFTITNDERAIRKLARPLTSNAKGREVRACYEAGTCGYTLQRRLESGGIVCEVIAPSLIPRKPGERVKTDRRDARKLAELNRAGVLTTVSPRAPPDEERSCGSTALASQPANSSVTRRRSALASPVYFDRRTERATTRRKQQRAP